jgi:cellulose biosynthesis protein BcsQ
MILAQCLAEHARTAILDLDTAAPSLALQLGLAEDLGGIIVACRQAEVGSLSSRSLTSSMSRLSENYYALTGLVHSRRWAELRPIAVSRVLERVRDDFDYGVLDVGAALPAAITGVPLPTDVTDAALGAADVVVAVCHAEPLGVARFLADLPDLVERGVPVVGVLNGGAQREQSRQLIREEALRLGLTMPIADLALNPNSLSSAVRRGISIRARRRFSRSAESSSRLVELVA